MRRRLGSIADFKGDFDKAFDGFIENNLPRDELWKQIEDEIEAKRKNKKKGSSIANIGGQPVKEREKVLSNPDEQPHEKVQKKVVTILANNEKEMIKEHEQLEEEERAKILIKKNKKKKKAGEASDHEDEKPVDHTEVPFKLEKQFEN